MALKLLKDNDGEVAADQVIALSVEEVQKWEGRHVAPVLMDLKHRILETCKDREDAIKLLEQPASDETEAVRAEAEMALAQAADEIAEITTERDALAARVQELEQKAAPQS